MARSRTYDLHEQRRLAEVSGPAPIGTEFEAARRFAGVSLNAVARRLGISPGLIASIERGTAACPKEVAPLMSALAAELRGDGRLPFRDFLISEHARIGWTLSQLASAAGASRRNVKEWEGGVLLPSAEQIATLRQLLPTVPTRHPEEQPQRRLQRRARALPGPRAEAPTTALGRLLVRARANAGWSRHELAAQAGIPPANVYLWERGKANPQRKSVLKLREALKGHWGETGEPETLATYFEPMLAEAAPRAAPQRQSRRPIQRPRGRRAARAPHGDVLRAWREHMGWSLNTAARIIGAAPDEIENCEANSADHDVAIAVAKRLQTILKQTTGRFQIGPAPDTPRPPVMLPGIDRAVSRLRQAAGLSHAQLAARCGVRPEVAKRWEKPGGRLRYDTLATVARGLSIPVETFFSDPHEDAAGTFAIPRVPPSIRALVTHPPPLPLIAHRSTPVSPEAIEAAVNACGAARPDDLRLGALVEEAGAATLAEALRDADPELPVTRALVMEAARIAALSPVEDIADVARIATQLGDLADPERAIAIFSARFGMAPEGEGDYQSIGLAHRVSRERIRQLLTRMLQPLTTRSITSPAVERELARLPALPPAALPDAIAPVRSIEGLRRYVTDVLRREWPASLAVEIAEALAQTQQWTATAARMAAAAAKARGVFHAPSLRAAVIERTNTVVSEPAMVQLLEELPRFEWLDQRREWAWFGPTGGPSSIEHAIHKMLVLAPNGLTLEEIMGGLIRVNRRYNEESGFPPLPMHVVQRICRRIPHVKARRRYYLAPSAPPPHEILGRSEASFVEIIGRLSNVASLAELVVEAKGAVSRATIVVLLTEAPFLVHLERGVYMLRGTQLDLAAMARARASTSRSPRHALE